jgi:hypothetical protein
MRLTAENYFSLEAQMAYMGASQFKAFETCEAAALAEIRGEYSRGITTALLVGSYVDAHFEGTLDVFRAKHPEIFTRSGDLRSEYRHAEYIIARIERDEMFMRYMSGQKQVIMTGEIEGVPVKAKLDVYHPGKCIVDLKIMKDFEPIWVDGQGKLPFVEAWGYDIQGAIYRHVEGNDLPFLLAVATKEKEPDIAMLSIPPDVIDEAMETIIASIRRYADIKAGKVEPIRCEKCDYCKLTKVLTRVVDYRDL